MIGIVAGIAVSQLVSNTANFSVKVDGSAPLNVQLLNQPTGTLYQDQWYNDAILLNVSNKDVNQGYDYFLLIKVVHSGIAPSFMTMKIKHSLGSQASYGSYSMITFQSDPSPNTINGTYKFGTRIHIDPLNGGQWKDFFLISFMVTSATSGTYNFYFSANV